MSTVMDQIVAAQDQAIDFVEKLQEPIVEPAAKLMSTIGENAPNLPFADMFPTPAELIRNQFAFAERWLAVSREFAFGVLGDTAGAKSSK